MFHFCSENLVDFIRFITVPPGFPQRHSNCSLDSDDDQVFCNPVMRIMRSQPYFFTGELLQWELIIEIGDVTLFIFVTVSAAPLVDLDVTN